MPARLIQRHDQFFKRLLDKPGAASALLRERLPPEVAARLSDEPPELRPGSFVAEDLREVPYRPAVPCPHRPSPAGRFSSTP